VKIESQVQPPRQDQQPPKVKYKKVKQFEMGFGVDLVNDKIALLIKLPWEQEYSMYEVDAKNIMRLNAQYQLQKLDLLEQLEAQVATQAEETAAQERRAAAKHIDASGNVVENEPTVDPTYDVPSVPLGGE
jgi:hypothetical protein